MKIIAGLFDHMVLQRNPKNQSEAIVSGEAKSDGKLFIIIKQKGRTLPGFKSVCLCKVVNGTFKACLRGLPVGGPYDISLEVKDSAGNIADSLQIRDVCVGDVWLLGGQSNMEGIGLLKDAAKADKNVRAFFMDDKWGVAKDPIHDLSVAVDQVHLDLCGGVPAVRAPEVGVGPGVAFGQGMEKLTGVPQGLIACGHGGTSMTQWNPALKKLGSKSLYGAMIRRFRKNGEKVAGLVWYQGCSDAFGSAEDVKLFTRRMKTFVSSVRRDCGQKNLPVAMVQISRTSGSSAGVPWNSIQDQQRRLQHIIPHCAVVPAIDLSLDDGIHISGKDQNRLGARLAQAMHVLKQGARAGRMPITLGKISKIEERGTITIKVGFNNVAGKLKSNDRPAGFCLRDTVDNLNSIFDVQLKGDCAYIRTVNTKLSMANKVLHYGEGTDPYCNITDEADRSLPVFGPVRFSPPKILSSYINKLRIGKLQFGGGNLNGMQYPNPAKLGLKMFEFPGAYCNRSAEFLKYASKDPLLYYACRIRCVEKMRLIIHLGHGGPVKVWVDRKELFYSPSGNHNTMPDMVRIPFDAAKGTHEIIVALSTDCANAYGIYLRIERKDRSKHGRKHQPVLPEILG